MPLVSIIIACLNDIRHLPRAVESVLNQTVPDIELIIMDGGSTDGTIDYLRSLQDSRVSWRSEFDGGITQAWNKAMPLAQGKWVLFLGADDFIWDTKVIANAALQLQESNAAFAFGEVCVVAEDSDNVIQRICFDKRALLHRLRGPKGLGLPHQGFFHNRRAFDEGSFDISFRLAADYEFISRFSAEQDFHFLSIGPIAAFRMGGVSTGPWATLETYREFGRIHRMRGRGRFHGAPQICRAYFKVLMKNVFGASVAKSLINGSRLLRGMPPYK